MIRHIPLSCNEAAIITTIAVKVVEKVPNNLTAFASSGWRSGDCEPSQNHLPWLRHPDSHINRVEGLKASYLNQMLVLMYDGTGAYNHSTRYLECRNVLDTTKASLSRSTNVGVTEYASTVISVNPLFPISSPSVQQPLPWSYPQWCRCSEISGKFLDSF